MVNKIKKINICGKINLGKTYWFMEDIVAKLRKHNWLRADWYSG